MAEIPLVAEPRQGHGSAASRRLRRLGRIPGVLYGHGIEPVALSVDGRELRAALSGEAGANALFDLTLNGAVHLAMARDVQHHPVRRTVSHVDFQVVARDEVVHADVPVALVGDALEVHRGGGTVEHVLVTLAVRARPTEIPAAIEVDVAKLAIGDTVRVADLVLPAGVSTDVDDETVVAVGLPPRVAVEEVPAAEGATGEGGAEA